jgi:hypothetical protein
MNKLQLLPVAAYRCRSGESYYPLLTGTIFDNTRQRPVTLVLLRGMAKGEPPARLVRELGLSRKQLHTLRQRLQGHLNATAHSPDGGDGWPRLRGG